MSCLMNGFSAVVAATGRAMRHSAGGRFLQRQRLALLALLGAMAMPLSVHAGTASGLVAEIVVEDHPTFGEAVNFNLVGGGGATGKPACSTAEWTFSLDSPVGRAYLAALISNRALGRPVAIVGNNQCDVWSNRETVTQITAQ